MGTLYDKASLVMIPSAVKDGKLYSVKPTNGDGDFTFSRGSNLAATRVNASGLIEKGRENLLPRSNQFDTTWTTTNVSVTSGQSGYDGSSDAWLLDTTVANGYLRQAVTFSGVSTFSIYAKPGTADGIYIEFAESAYPYLKVNLSTQSFISSTNIIDYNIEDAGNGWNRISFSMDGSHVRVNIKAVDNTGAVTSGTIYIQDAQLEQGLVATDYIETGATTAQAGILENMPRLDYSGGSPALLLEPQRTNILNQSEYFGGYSNSNSTDTANDAESPEGVNNATFFKEAATTGQHKLFTSATFDGSSTYTFSIFAKHNGRDLYVDTQNSNEWGGRAWFDLTAGKANAILGTADIEDFGNGWYRCILTGASTLAGGNFIELLTSDGSTNSTTGDVTKGVYIYGAQLEQGSYPTSYIPTYGTSVTRDLPTLQNLSLANYIGQTQGTIFLDVEYLDGARDDVFRINNNVDGIGISKSQYSMVMKTYQSGVGTDTVVSTTADSIKVAYVYTSSGIKMFINGSLSTSRDFSVSFGTTLNELRLYGTPYYLDRSLKRLNQVLVFPTALTDEEAIALTT